MTAPQSRMNRAPFCPRGNADRSIVSSGTCQQSWDEQVTGRDPSGRTHPRSPFKRSRARAVRVRVAAVTNHRRLTWALSTFGELFCPIIILPLPRQPGSLTPKWQDNCRQNDRKSTVSLPGNVRPARTIRVLLRLALRAQSRSGQDARRPRAERGLCPVCGTSRSNVRRSHHGSSTRDEHEDEDARAVRVA